MPARRPWLLGLSDLALGVPAVSNALGANILSLLETGTKLATDLTPAVVSIVQAGKRNKRSSVKKRRTKAAPETVAAPPPPPAPVRPAMPSWAIPAALGVTAIVGALLLTRPRPAPAYAPAPYPYPVRNPRRHGR